MKLFYKNAMMQDIRLNLWKWGSIFM